MIIVLLLDFYLGVEGLFIVIVMVVGGNVGVSCCGIMGNVIVVFDIVLFFILFCVGGENMDSWMWLDVVVCLLLLCQGDFILIVMIVGLLRFYVVVVDF